jgi:hypothetical protein
MGDKTILDIIVNLLGLGIFLWLLSQSIIDLVRGTRRRTVFHNLLIIGISLVYTLKIVLKDLFGVM